jgi:Flp pilus assembly protein TadD
MNEGDELVTQGDIDAAVEEYRRAEELLPGESEPVFWHAVTLAGAGRLSEALPLFAEAYRLRPAWRELVPRLVPARLLPDDRKMIERIVSAGR